jgi:hypothetical protein
MDALEEISQLQEGSEDFDEVRDIAQSIFEIEVDLADSTDEDFTYFAEKAFSAARIFLERVRIEKEKHEGDM